MDSRLGELANLLEQIEDTASREQENFEIFKEKKLVPAKQAYDDMQAVRELKDKRQGIQYELCSWQYKDWSKAMQDLDKKKAKLDADKERVLAEIAKAEEGGRSSRERVAEFKAEVEMQQQRAQRPAAELAEVDKRLRAKRKERAERENSKKTLKRDIDNLNGDIADVRKRARDQEAEAAKLRAKKNPDRPVSKAPEYREKMETLKDKLHHKSFDKEQLETVDKEKGRQYQEAQERLKIIDNHVQMKQANVQRLESVGKGNSMARFGKDVPAIAAAFKAAEKQFAPGHAPVGPVGQYVKLKDPKWGLALCDATQWNKGGQTWLVHSVKDLDTCRKILKDKRLNTFDFQVRTLNPDHFEAKIGSAPEPSILDVIEIDHPNKDCARYIRNFLVDAFSVNELRLAEDVMAAKAVVERPIEQVTLPNGVRHDVKRTCYSLNADKTAVERVQTKSKSGGLTSYYISSNRPNPYEVDVSAQKNQAQRELTAAKTERDEHKQVFDAADQAKKASFKDVAAVTKEVQSLQKDIGSLENAIRKDEAEQAKWKDADADEQDQEIRALEDLSAFDEQERDLRQQIDSIADEMKGIDVATAKMKEEEQELEGDKQVVERRRQDILRELKDAEKALQAELEDSEKRNGTIDTSRTLLQKIQSKWNEAEAKLVETTQLRDAFEQKIPESYGWKEKGADVCVCMRARAAPCVVLALVCVQACRCATPSLCSFLHLPGTR